mgnify:CR=1 FL=1
MINKQTEHSIGCNQSGRRTDADAWSSTRKGIQWRCCGKHTCVPRSSASLPKNCTKETMENGRGEASGFGPTTLRLLYPAIPLSLRLPFFYSFQKGAVSLINYLPTQSNYLGFSTLYIKGAHTWTAGSHALCADCAWGRFSSRQRVVPHLWRYR